MGLCCQKKFRKAERGLSADQNFGDLDGVEGGAFAQVVGDDPQDNPLKKGLADLTKPLKRKFPIALHWIFLLIF
jgi:hypothetical protein